MCAGINYAIPAIGMRQIGMHVMVFSEGKKQDFHAGQSEVIHYLAYIGSDKAEVFRDDWHGRASLKDRGKESFSRRLYPAAFYRSRFAGRHFPV